MPNKNTSDFQLDSKLATKMAHCIRFLALDAVERAASGHPGMPMGMADVATILFSEFLKFDAKKPEWLNRDRFVLSAGHGSMLLYSLLYLTGYKDIEIDDLKTFRQLGAKAAGHPEYKNFAGIETSTGPLGQGLANAVGMAIAEKMLAARLGEKIIDHKTYCLVGDGCLMEGISHEAISLAGHLALNKLIVLWDDNSISIDGNTNLAVSENTRLRFEAQNWKVLEADGHNVDEIRAALAAAQKSDKPVLIAFKTMIAFGSPTHAGTARAHGSPLGHDEIKKIRANLEWHHAPFVIPEELRDKWLEVGVRSEKIYKEWKHEFDHLPAEQLEFVTRALKHELPENFKKKLEQFKQKVFLAKPKQSTRKSSGNTLEFLTAELPELIGGAADLTDSVFTKTAVTEVITKSDFSGRYIHYGVREHAMGAIMNGIALYGCFRPYGGTFLVFSDYMRPAIRLAAMMELPVIYIFTHDSIGLGEDGPTHQPIEQLPSLRTIPNLNIFRPADAQEAIGCFEQALKHKHTPAAMILTRQDVEFLRTHYNRDEASCSFGGYIMSDTALEIEPDAVIIASGSEVSIAMKAKELLNKKGLAIRVVSMPCVELFEKQPKEYKRKVLGPKHVLKVAVEAAISLGWYRYIGNDGIFIGMTKFGASGKAADLYKHFNITAEEITKQVSERVKETRDGAIRKYKDKDDMLDEIEIAEEKGVIEEESEE